MRPAQVIGEVGTTVVTAVTYDHRDVTAGALHCCLPGERVDGHDFAGLARRAGAVAFVCERPLGDEADGAVQFVVERGAARPAMAEAACALWGDPAAALRTVGVTGTNGKTTTTYFLRSVLQANGWPTAVIGTLVGARTTPESPDLQRAFAQARDAGCSAVALEVTSHALAQHRADGYRHDVAVFTNLSQDHLDFHGTLEAYFEAKANLFTPDHAEAGVANADDPYGRRLLATAPITTRPYALEDAKDLTVGLIESRFVLDGEPVRIQPGGTFNVMNALAAAAAAKLLGVPATTVAEGLSSAERPPGRLEPVANGLGATVVVDYAHTPAALAEVLRAARAEADRSRGRVVVVFGCGGDRDREKRPLMASAATHLADIAVLTSDNPRHEDPLAIIDEVRSGADGPARFEVEPDRRAAIALGVSICEPGDVLVVAGKGHEVTQQIGDELVAFDDRAVLRALVGAPPEEGVAP